MEPPVIMKAITELLKRKNQTKTRLMKYSNAIAIAAATLCGVASSGHAIDIVNDTFADGNRTSAGPDGFGGIDSTWYASANAASTAAAGHMYWAVPAGSLFNTTYFPFATFPYTNTVAAANAITLVNPGDTLSVTWVFSMTGLNAGNANQNLNLALVSTPTTHLVNPTGSASPASQNYAGYAMFMNISPTLNQGSPFALREWVVGSGALLGTSANWGANGVANANLANDGLTGNAGYAAGTEYTYQMTLTLNGLGGLDILSTMTGAGLNGVGGLTNSITDATPNGLTYDTFAVRMGTSSATASQFDTTLFKVEFTPVPEPATIALVGFGLLGLTWGYRRSRR
jgi:hypothetical protein